MNAEPNELPSRYMQTASGEVVDLRTGEVVHSPLDPRQRFELIRRCVREAARYELAASVLLAWALDHDEWRKLDYATEGDYVLDLGLSRSQASKMTKIAHVFGGGWEELPEHDQAQLNVGRLYVQAQRVEARQIEPGEALREAVDTPVHELIARRDAEAPPEQTRPVECASCGQVHQCPGQRPEF